MAKLEPLEVNPYFSQNHTLPYAPFGSQYETPGMGVLDLIMTHDDGNDTYMAHGLSRLEKLAHGMHMLELWHKTSKVYHELSQISDNLCSCLTDESQNGILNELIFISKYMRNFGNADNDIDHNNPGTNREAVAPQMRSGCYRYRCGRFETFRYRGGGGGGGRPIPVIQEAFQRKSDVAEVQERNSDGLPALNNPASWTAWKKMLAFSMLHDDEIEYFAKYMHCKINNDV